ncbi:S8 family serine peptidase [Modestobacter sp. L9-4]|uniref:S8 family serine peptidase n=1 Tax=Modestobacter sp. L9-4 TaxID=2851567 RepID=UPI001C7786F2|nr:S8 family serine peptidase [Modestobacter sp. L9-4]QXG74816.1 S8 family serine peptidase [Modestobacter sp. L9-4]
MSSSALPRSRRTSAAVVAGSTLAAVVLGAVPANAATGSLGYDAVADKGSLYNVAEVLGAHTSYASGITGRGIGVALIDTGVAPVPGLTSGNVVTGPDLSFDSQDRDAAHVDGFGHGTHLASIIAGRDVAGTPASYANPGRFAGIAPDSTLVNVKVGAGNGAVDVTQVIAGIDWTVEHAKDPGLNIRVINLSYGTDSLQSSSVDPLAYAVENAWKHGIVVVVAGGNEGDTTKTLANPASDPFVLAVGAMDDAGTVTRSDDTVPSWSTHGTDGRHVDVVAPGVSVLGLRVPGGTADVANPQARVGDRFARASGTSQAAAVVSGEVALLLQAFPLLTPDQVKGVITHSASGVSTAPTKLAGAGTIDVVTAQKLPKAPLPQPIAPAIGWSRGTGSLEASRGSSHVSNGSTELTGEVDLFGRAWNGAAWARSTSDGTAWNGGNWRGAALTGGAWNRGVWPTATWTGNDWSGVSYTSDQWSARTWRDDSWSARTWRDDSWSARTWRDEGWR